MDDRQVLLGMLIGSRRDGALDRATRRYGEHDGEPNASGIASAVVELGARLSMPRQETG